MNTFTLDKLYQLQIQNNMATVDNSGGIILILKLTARWCSPCKIIAPICHTFMDVWGKVYPEQIQFHEIDIDENPLFYSLLKKYKIVRGVPALLCYDKNKVRDLFPTDMVNTGERMEVIQFFNRCLELL